MDLCNLYIKGLSLAMTSTELFNLFKPFGRIISARVMDSDRGISKGFGFVSFSHPLEAASALVHLHRQYSIQFHEPKMTRPDHDILQQYWCLAHSSLAPYFYPSSSFPSTSSLVSTTTDPTMIPYYLYPSRHYPYPPSTPTSFYYPPTHSYYASSFPPAADIYMSHQYLPPPLPPIQQQQQDQVMTGSSSHVTPRTRMQLAVQQALVNDKEQQTMVDMMMMLDQAEQQKCLQDQAYLKERLDEIRQSR
ncbi:uncharacterized protein BX664DRAFT_289382 [Halteromyces radiatus]|uniref:uncharacterized protein n=1 Tax=Halteromyces radiatus TaxID=101107 RepID=UPI00221E905F|nr:uncharacterized protein BX664DRAFT_289382 [Halteromyces radiatus]KAI8099336.1 hypothetical protein BX664DRAFT_289382 [Halteromyces radiatus]